MKRRRSSEAGVPVGGSLPPQLPTQPLKKPCALPTGATTAASRFEALPACSPRMALVRTAEGVEPTIRPCVFAADVALELVDSARECQFGVVKPGWMIVEEVAVGVELPGGAQVFRRTEQAVAVKIMSQVLVANHMSRVSGVRVSEDGAREIEIMQLLSEPGHPHLIELLGCYHDDNNVYVIMELAEGGDLFDILERVGRFGEANLRPLIQQVASALQYMHAQCVAHRDVSVENVVLKRISGPLQPGAGAGPSVAVEAKLIDFGLSRRMPQDTLTGQRALCTPERSGKVMYLAPEVYAALGPYDPFAADVWALAVSIIILITGSAPYDAPVLVTPPALLPRSPPPALVPCTPASARRQQQHQKTQQQRRAAGTPTKRNGASTASPIQFRPQRKASFTSPPTSPSQPAVPAPSTSGATDAPASSAPAVPPPLRSSNGHTRVGGGGSSVASPSSTPSTGTGTPGTLLATSASATAAASVLDLMVSGRITDALRACNPDCEPSPSLVDLLRCMLHLDPAMRPSMAQVALHPWVTGAPACAVTPSSPAGSVHSAAQRVPDVPETEAPRVPVAHEATLLAANAASLPPANAASLPPANAASLPAANAPLPEPVQEPPAGPAVCPAPLPPAPPAPPVLSQPVATPATGVLAHPPLLPPLAMPLAFPAPPVAVTPAISAPPVALAALSGMPHVPPVPAMPAMPAVPSGLAIAQPQLQVQALSAMQSPAVAAMLPHMVPQVLCMPVPVALGAPVAPQPHLSLLPGTGAGL